MGHSLRQELHVRKETFEDRHFFAVVGEGWGRRCRTLCTAFLQSKAILAAFGASFFLVFLAVSNVAVHVFLGPFELVIPHLFQFLSARLSGKSTDIAGEKLGFFLQSKHVPISDGFVPLFNIKTLCETRAFGSAFLLCNSPRHEEAGQRPYLIFRE